MPTISIFYGIIIMMYLKGKKHNPPHVHAFYGEKAATFFISNGEIMDGDFPNRGKTLVKEFITKYKNELLDMWNNGTYRKLDGIE